MDDSLEERYAGFMKGKLRHAACLSWIRGISPDEALRRLGASGVLEARTVEEIADLCAALDGAKDASGAWLEPVGAVAGSLGDWTILVEPNGFAGTVGADLHALSAGTEALSVFWNVNALAELAVARNGQTTARIHEILDYIKGDDEPAASQADVEGTDPTLVHDLVAALADVEGYEWRPPVLSWIERHTGTRMPPGWLDGRHPSAAFGKRRQ